MDASNGKTQQSSIYQTCEYKGMSFLKFLVSKETDMDEYCRKMRN